MTPRAPPLRPPQQDPGHQHHQRPAGGKLHDIAAGLARQQRRVDAPHDRHGLPRRITLAGYMGTIGIDIDVAVGAAGQPHLPQRCLIGEARQPHALHDGAWPRGADHRFLIGEGAPCRAGGDGLHIGIPPSFDLAIEQIERAGDRQQDQHRRHEQPGIKMPAPDRAIGGRGAAGMVGPRRHGESRRHQNATPKRALTVRGSPG